MRRLCGYRLSYSHIVPLRRPASSFVSGLHTSADPLRLLLAKLFTASPSHFFSTHSGPAKRINVHQRVAKFTPAFQAALCTKNEATTPQPFHVDSPHPPTHITGHVAPPMVHRTSAVSNTGQTVLRACTNKRFVLSSMGSCPESNP